MALTQEQQTNLVPFAAKVDAQYTGQPLKLTQSFLIDLWESGVLTAKPYACLALIFDRIGFTEVEEFDVHQFIERWQGTEANNKGDYKQLKEQDVFTALKHMERQGYGSVEQTLRVKLNVDG